MTLQQEFCKFEGAVHGCVCASYVCSACSVGLNACTLLHGNVSAGLLDVLHATWCFVVPVVHTSLLVHLASHSAGLANLVWVKFCVGVLKHQP